MTIKFFIFCLWKRIYFARKHCLGKCSLYYYIASKFLFSVAGYLKWSNETPTTIQICIGLVVDVLLWPKILGNRVNILTLVLNVMDNFFRSQKSTFNLENNKCICQGNLFIYHKLNLFTPILFFELCFSQGYIQNFESNWKKSICIRVSNFAKSINFYRSLYKEKIQITKAWIL